MSRLTSDLSPVTYVMNSDILGSTNVMSRDMCHEGPGHRPDPSTVLRSCPSNEGLAAESERGRQDCGSTAWIPPADIGRATGAGVFAIARVARLPLRP